MAPNPNPARTTAPMWRFIERVLALEPDDFVFAGAYVLKRSYHSTVEDNLARWPGDYSIRLAADLRGPRDKGRALDIKSRQAAAGKQPTIMARYGARMRAAAKARDPRVRKWREVLGQFDVDTPPEAIDFQSLAERQPDDTHEWHIHWSILTAFVNDPEAYDAMYSVLIGQSLAEYLREEAKTMGQQLLVARQAAPNEVWLVDGMYRRRVNHPTENQDNKNAHSANLLGNLGNGGQVYLWPSQAHMDYWGIDVDTLRVGQAVVADAQIEAIAQRAAAAVVARDDNPLGEADVPALVAAFKQAAREGTGTSAD